jgi:hypothetical protein
MSTFRGFEPPPLSHEGALVNRTRQQADRRAYLEALRQYAAAHRCAVRVEPPQPGQPGRWLMPNGEYLG